MEKPIIYFSSLKINLIGCLIRIVSIYTTSENEMFGRRYCFKPNNFSI